ncbi:hypothetical protein CPC08DRAFT_372937 [Agrocybe pediades]|nr:hypothetical protein CPC08DRAFT_372937 [Agrocybe pediades]
MTTSVAHQPIPTVIHNEKTCYITRLPHEVLWNIFSMNANMYDDEPSRKNEYHLLADLGRRAMVTTWKSTHVCRQWREIIIGATSLWGKLIDLEVLSFIDHIWFNEIMARTGSLYLSKEKFPETRKRSAICSS